MTIYLCGHKTDRAIKIKNDQLAIQNYALWKTALEIYGHNKMCFNCWNKIRNKDRFIEKIENERRERYERQRLI